LKLVFQRYPAPLYKDAEQPGFPKGLRIKKHLAKGNQHLRELSHLNAVFVLKNQHYKQF